MIAIPVMNRLQATSSMIRSELTGRLQPPFMGRLGVSFRAELQVTLWGVIMSVARSDLRLALLQPSGLRKSCMVSGQTPGGDTGG